MFRKFLVATSVLATLPAGGASAAITIHTNQASFLAAITNPETDTFDDLALGILLPPLERTVGNYNYTINGSGILHGVGSADDVWLSTDATTDSVIFNNFSSGVTGFGGFFFNTNNPGDYILGNIVLTATDSRGTVSHNIMLATTNSFVGFVSTSGLQQVTMSTFRSGVNRYPTVNDVTLGTGAIPEPASWALLIAGFGLVGASLRRRRLAMA